MLNGSGLRPAATVRLFLLSSCIVFFDLVSCAYVRLEVLTVVARKTSVFWIMMPCRLRDKCRHFRGTTLSSSEYMALTSEVLPYITYVMTGLPYLLIVLS